MKYSIVVPIYGDGRLAEALCGALHDVMTKHLGTEDISDQVELIFVNDGSKNDSLVHLLALPPRYPFVRIVDLSRNFGQHVAIACGLRQASGEIVFRMNVDMQDHPCEIPKILESLNSGDADLVIGQYEERHSPWLDRLTAFIYYRFFQFMTGFEGVQNTSPLRAMRRRYVDAYNLLTERTRFPQGLDQWLGFKVCYVPIVHRKRQDGRSTYSFWSRLQLGVNGILYFSERPLLLVIYLGFLLALGGVSLAVFEVVMRLLASNILPGYTSLAAIGLFGFGIQMMGTGVVGVYVAKIFKEVQNRPLYLIREKYGFEGPPHKRIERHEP
jgi:glycosyltransferase involved in cell wall biosynthesis